MTGQQYPLNLSCASYAGVVPLILLSTCLLTQPACSAAGQSQAIEITQRAEQALARQQYTESVQLAKQAAALDQDSYAIQQRAAEILYRSGDCSASLPCFDRAIALAPSRAAGNWQRGLALATCGKFDEGAAQFKLHHDVNPDDVENSAWYFLCVAKTQGLEAARRMVIPSGGDPREPMMSVLKLLQGKCEPADVFQAAIDNTRPGSSRTTAKFYADLYVGLYYDAVGEPQSAAKYLRRSLSYGIDGYMADTARVYLADRFPDDEGEDLEAIK